MSSTYHILADLERLHDSLINIFKNKIKVIKVIQKQKSRRNHEVHIYSYGQPLRKKQELWPQLCLHHHRFVLVCTVRSQYLHHLHTRPGHSVICADKLAWLGHTTIVSLGSCDRFPCLTHCALMSVCVWDEVPPHVIPDVPGMFINAAPDTCVQLSAALKPAM